MRNLIKEALDEQKKIDLLKKRVCGKLYSFNYTCKIFNTPITVRFVVEDISVQPHPYAEDKMTLKFLCLANYEGNIGGTTLRDWIVSNFGPYRKYFGLNYEIWVQGFRQGDKPFAVTLSELQK